MHLGDLISKLGVGAGHWAFQGYEKLCPSIIDSIGNDFFNSLLSYFTDSGSLNTSQLKSFLESLSDGPMNYFTRDATQTTWKSNTTNLEYGPDNEYGHRFLHILRHCIPEGAGHSVFTSSARGQLFQLLDEAWSKGVTSKPGDPLRFDIEMNKVVGTAGETKIRMIVDPNTLEVKSAFPILNLSY